MLSLTEVSLTEVSLTEASFTTFFGEIAVVGYGATREHKHPPMLVHMHVHDHTHLFRVDFSMCNCEK